MQAGDVLAGRFVIKRLAGSGGMGTVYRADDTITGEPVAVKVMTGADDTLRRRFEQEARVLASLRHPHIVRYVAHGTTPSRDPFLAMEWLDGEDLATRIARQSITPAESLALARGLAAALAFAHERQVIHRDIKPSNIFLVGRDTSQVRVLDFGIARTSSASMRLTATGAVVGTLGYMSPEQAQGFAETSAASDVFSCGCVLYECIAGRAAFSADNVMALLARLLLERPTPLAALRADLPQTLTLLIDAMLEKSPQDRPRDGAAVLRRLSEVDRGAVVGARAAVHPQALSAGGERQVVSVMLIDASGGTAPSDRTVTPDEEATILRAVREAAQEFSADTFWLSTGMVLVHARSAGTPGDLAARMVRCALAVLPRVEHARIAVATGHAETSRGAPVGGTIDRVAELVARVPPGTVGIDELTETFVDRWFAIDLRDGIRVIGSARADVDAPRRLLGRDVPFMGRDRELSLLESTLAETVDDAVARVFVVTAGPGVGKSRLRQEFVARARTRGDVRILTARCNDVGGATPFALVRALARTAACVRDENVPDARNAFARHVRALVAGTDAEVVIDALGPWIADATWHARSSGAALDATEGRTLPEKLDAALARWFDAETRGGPTLIVVEDAHWGDPASLVLLSDAVRHFADRPVLVLLFARPDLFTVVPGFANASYVEELKLPGITRRMCERLARIALGGDGSDAAVRIAERCDGNPFFLEELVRRYSSTGALELPESVISTVQARMLTLDTSARTVVRMASVLGDRFDVEALAHLIDRADLRETLGDVLEELRSAEVLEREQRSGDRVTQYAFRHALLREAAHAMLTDTTRRAAHLAAADWLEARADSEPSVLLHHLRIAGASVRAAPWHLAASLRAASLGRLDQALAHLSEGLVEGISDTLRAELLARRCLALAWMGRWDEVLETGPRVVAALSPSDDAWIEVVATTLYAGLYRGDADAVGIAIRALSGADVSPRPTSAWGSCLMGVVVGLLNSGRTAEALAFHARVRQAINDEPSGRAFAAFVRIADAVVASQVHCDPADALRNAREAIRYADESRDDVAIGFARGVGALLLADVGCFAESDKWSSEVLARPATHEQSVARDWAAMSAAYSSSLRGLVDDTRVALGRVGDRANTVLAGYAAVLPSLATLVSGTADDPNALSKWRDAPWVSRGGGALIAAVAAHLALRRGEPAEAAAWLASHGELDASLSAARLLFLSAQVAAWERTGAAERSCHARDSLRAILSDALSKFDRPEDRGAWTETFAFGVASRSAGLLLPDPSNPSSEVVTPRG